MSVREALERLPALPSGFERKTLSCALHPGDVVDLATEHGRLIEEWVDRHAGCETEKRPPAHAGWK